MSHPLLRHALVVVAWELHDDDHVAHGVVEYYFLEAQQPQIKDVYQEIYQQDCEILAPMRAVFELVGPLRQLQEGVVIVADYQILFLVHFLGIFNGAFGQGLDELGVHLWEESNGDVGLYYHF